MPGHPFGDALGRGVRVRGERPERLSCGRADHLTAVRRCRVEDVPGAKNVGRDGLVDLSLRKAGVALRGDVEDQIRLDVADERRDGEARRRTIQDIEQGRSDGTVQTMSRIFGMLGLKPGVVRKQA